MGDLIVIALGGNALLRRGEPLEADIQRKNIATYKGAAVVRRARRMPVLAPASLALTSIVQQMPHVESAQYVQQAAHVVKVWVGVEHCGKARLVVIGQGRGHQRLPGVKTRRGAAPAVQQQAHMARQP